MLLWYTPDLHGYQPDGSQRAWWSFGPTPQGKRRYKILRSGFRLAIAMLFLGFLLQLLDLLRG